MGVGMPALLPVQHPQGQEGQDTHHASCVPALLPVQRPQGQEGQDTHHASCSVATPFTSLRRKLHQEGGVMPM
jgi:hypothetical protein